MSLRSAGDPGCVLITGCSSGIGRACTEELARCGVRVFAGVRRAEDAEALRGLSPGQVEPVMLDVLDPPSVRAAAEMVQESVGTRGLAGLVNNAGIAIPGPWELLSPGDVRRQLEVNVVGTHAVTQAMLPLLRRAAGRVVMVGSISGRLAPPYFGAYAASKHALEAMADSLRIELRPWRISVSVVEPDAVATPLWDKFGRGLAALGCQTAAAASLYEESLRRLRGSAARSSRTGMPVSAVVHAVHHALFARRPKARYPVGWRTRLAVWASPRLPTRLLDWIVLRTMGLS